MRPLILSLCLALAVASSSAASDASPAPTPQPGSSQRGDVVDLPIDLSSGRPRIVGRLNDGPLEPIEFDTGSNGPALIQRAQAERLNLPVVGEEQMASPYANTPPMTVKLVLIDKLAVGGMTLRNVRAMVMDDASFIGADAPLIVGPHQFPNKLVTLDYPKGRFTLSSRAPKDRQAWQAQGDHGLLETTISIGATKVPLHIDSGSPGALMLPKSLAQQIYPGIALRQVGAIRTVDRELPLFLGDLHREAEIGGVPASLGQTIFADVPYANLGSEGLGAFRIVIDNPRHRWRLETSGPQKPFLDSSPKGKRLG